MKRVSTRRSRGQALIEFSLLLPIIIVLVGGLTDMGLFIYVSIGTQNAVREGARIASTIPGLGPNDSTVQAEVISRIPQIEQFPFSQLTVTNTEPNDPTSCEDNVTVTVTGTYNFAFLRYIGFTDTTMVRSTTMRYEMDRPLCT